MIKHVETVAEFDELVKAGKVLVDFYADWCGPCKMLAPVLEDLSKDVEELIIKVNVDDLPALAQRYKVQAIPTLYVLNDGVVLNHALGYQNKNQLLQLLGK